MGHTGVDSFAASLKQLYLHDMVLAMLEKAAAALT